MSFSLLIADDSKMSRNKIKKIVSSFISDIEVNEANNGQEALEICRSKNLDLMLLDLNGCISFFTIMTSLRKLG